LKLAAIESQGLLQAISSSKFSVAETFRLHLLLVLDDANISAFATGKEVVNVGDSSIKREISEMYSIGRFVGKRKFFTNRVA
jgi:hypothetical protein